MKKSNIQLIFLIFLTNFLFAQKLPREILKGKIVGDSDGIENINVKNLNTNKLAISDKFGLFALYAQENDTLVFSGMNINLSKLVLKKADLNVKILWVKLETFVNTLDEVIINPNALTGNLALDSKNIKITEIKPLDFRLALNTDFENDKFSSPTNKLMPGYLNTKYMTDLVAVAGKIVKLFKGKSKPKKVVFISKKNFHDAVRERFSLSFFTQTLKLKEDEIGLFLAFCENDSNANPLLDINKTFELIDFLIQKNKKYQLSKKN